MLWGDFSRATDPPIMRAMRALARDEVPVVGSAHLLVAIPALDEERTIADVIRSIPRQIAGVGSLEVLVVDDGSTDGTAEEARRAGARVERHESTRGVGAAFCTALHYGRESGADLIVSIDADGQFDAGDIPRLVEPVLRGEADFTTASRFLDPSLIPDDMPAVKRWGNRVMARIISKLAGQRIHDVSCGMRCYGRRAAMELNPMASFTYTQEILLNLAFKHLRIVEVPIRVRGVREHGKSRVANSVIRYGFRTTLIMARCYRDYRPMALFGGLALGVGGVGLLLSTFLGIHYLMTGFFTGLIGDMLTRHRIYLEELLYESRRRAGAERSVDSQLGRGSGTPR